DSIDRPVARGRDQPGARVLRRSVARPSRRGGRERLLRSFLGEVEVAEEADECGEHAPPFVAKDLLEAHQDVSTGRTSIAPPRRAAGTRDAISIAASRSSASRTKNPPIASLIPRNGPSVTSVLPSVTRTVVATPGRPSASPGVTAGFWLSAP